MKKKMLVLVGKMASGKTTVAKILENKKGFKRVVTVTTRPPRPGEIDGVDYHFVSDETFQQMLADGSLAEYACYNAKFGKVYYGSLKESYNVEEDTVIILNPKGLKMIKDNKIPHISIFLDPDKQVLKERLVGRGDDPEEVERRLSQDDEDFKDIKTDIHLRRFSSADATADIVVNYLRSIEKLSMK